MTRVAILGLGGAAAQIHLPACALLPSVDVVGGCDPDAEVRRTMGRRFGISALEEDPEALLDRTTPDVVIVATPPATHHRLCMLSLGRGHHVLCEKPFASTVDEADEIIAEAERRKCSIMVNTQYRHAEIYRVPQARIAAGDYGNPFLIQCWQQMFHPPSMEQNWHAGLVQSTLFEFGTHPLDLLCFFFGDLPISITAHTPRPAPGLDADVIVQATLRFPGERMATLMLNRVSRAPERYLEMRIDCDKASLRISFGGLARASLSWSRALGRPTGRFSLVRGGEARLESGGRSRVLARERRDFRAAATARYILDLAESSRESVANNDQARRARDILSIVFAGYESARTGQTVPLSYPGA